uniref:G-protein coupled receptors family 1 profile domain-containing protein n=1 Tax=Panagrellus redivivus TaxID=6233 RepID=A0A7E4UWW0_PANRE
MNVLGLFPHRIDHPVGSKSTAQTPCVVVAPSGRPLLDSVPPQPPPSYCIVAGLFYWCLISRIVLLTRGPANGNGARYRLTETSNTSWAQNKLKWLLDLSICIAFVGVCGNLLIFVFSCLGHADSRLPEIAQHARQVTREFFFILLLQLFSLYLIEFFSAIAMDSAPPNASRQR